MTSSSLIICMQIHTHTHASMCMQCVSQLPDVARSQLTARQTYILPSHTLSLPLFLAVWLFLLSSRTYAHVRYYDTRVLLELRSQLSAELFTAFEWHLLRSWVVSARHTLRVWFACAPTQCANCSQFCVSASGCVAEWEVPIGLAH